MSLKKQLGIATQRHEPARLWQAVTIHWTGLLDWTTGLTFDLKCSIYMKKFMFYLCEKNYIDRAHGFFAQSTVQYSIGVSSFPSDLDWFSDDFERTWK